MNDVTVETILKNEAKRQQETINLIASENYVSDDVLKALGSAFTNKYSEGYPGARYYGGNQYADEIELLCQQRALALFGLSPDEWTVNVQALSGSPANLAVYTALLGIPVLGAVDGASVQPTIMGLDLAHGGHLTHGHKASVTGKWWRQISYTVDPETERLDYNAIGAVAMQQKPTMIVAGYTAYSRAIDWETLRSIADQCGALLHADVSHYAGLIAGGVYTSPFRYADTVMMTTHKTLRGPRGALIFSRKDSRGLDTKIDKAVFPGLQGGPHMNNIAGIAVCLLEASTPAFVQYTKQIILNANAMAGALQKLGWRIVSGGTDSHMFLVDTWNGGKGISGKVASDMLEAQGIVVNKNTIPFDMRSPVDPSGIRIGVAAETTRGKKESDMVAIAEKINQIFRTPQAPSPITE